MITRRLFCGCLAVGLPFASTAVQAQSPECAVFTPDRQKATAPDEAIARLKAGNERFTAGKSINCDLMAQVKQTASNQSPFAAIVGCIDSRVPPELVFDQRIGDVDRTIDGVKVTVDGAPLDPCVNVVEFTKNGFEWSYEGPEPRQLALALLVDHLGDKDRAKAAVEPFMQAVVANFDNEWEMTSADLDEALAALGKAVA